MSDPSNVAKIDLHSLSDFQKSLYFPKKGEEVESRFSSQPETTNWSTHLLIKLTSRTESEEITYTPNMKLDYLLYTFLKIRLPTLKIKDEFKDIVQFRWPHNIGLNLVKEGSLCFDDEKVQSFDNIWLNIYSQFYIPGSRREEYSLLIGNVPLLQEWTNQLPEFTLFVPQPWYYSSHEVLAIPLFLCSLSTVTHKYRFRLKLEEILRMRIYKDDQWKDIPYSSKYIENVSVEESIPTPELWGRHVQITDTEREWRMNERNKMYINDITSFATENTYGFGATVSIDLHCENPCKAIFWVAQNIESVKNRDFSNFSTNTENHLFGWNPIVSSKLLYGGSHRIQELESAFFDRIESWYHYPSVPIEPGYNTYSFSYNSMSYFPDISIVFNDLKAKLVLKIGDSDPLRKQIDTDFAYEEDTPKKQSFRVFVKLIVIKKIRFVEKSQAKKKNTRSTIYVMYDKERTKISTI